MPRPAIGLCLSHARARHGAWDEVRIDGSVAGQDFTARYFRNGRLVAAASCGRDRENLDIESELSRQAPG